MISSTKGKERHHIKDSILTKRLGVYGGTYNSHLDEEAQLGELSHVI